LPWLDQADHDGAGMMLPRLRRTGTADSGSIRQTRPACWL